VLVLYYIVWVVIVNVWYIHAHAVLVNRYPGPFPITREGAQSPEFDLTDPDSIEGAVTSLKKQAEQALSGKWGETPVKLANIMRRSTEDFLHFIRSSSFINQTSTLCHPEQREICSPSISTRTVNAPPCSYSLTEGWPTQAVLRLEWALPPTA
jgi:hypothetical protein